MMGERAVGERAAGGRKRRRRKRRRRRRRSGRTEMWGTTTTAIPSLTHLPCTCALRNKISVTCTLKTFRVWKLGDWGRGRLKGREQGESNNTIHYDTCTVRKKKGWEAGTWGQLGFGVGRYKKLKETRRRIRYFFYHKSSIFFLTSDIPLLRLHGYFISEEAPLWGWRIQILEGDAGQCILYASHRRDIFVKMNEK